MKRDFQGFVYFMRANRENSPDGFWGATYQNVTSTVTLQKYLWKKNITFKTIEGAKFLKSVTIQPHGRITVELVDQQKIDGFGITVFAAGPADAAPYLFFHQAENNCSDLPWGPTIEFPSTVLAPGLTYSIGFNYVGKQDEQNFVTLLSEIV
jgi:hypothetical protein